MRRCAYRSRPGHDSGPACRMPIAATRLRPPSRSRGPTPHRRGSSPSTRCDSPVPSGQTAPADKRPVGGTVHGQSGSAAFFCHLTAGRDEALGARTFGPGRGVPVAQHVGAAVQREEGVRVRAGEGAQSQASGVQRRSGQRHAGHAACHQRRPGADARIDARRQCRGACIPCPGTTDRPVVYALSTSVSRIGMRVVHADPFGVKAHTPATTQTPLFASTSRAKSSQVSTSSGRVV